MNLPEAQEALDELLEVVRNEAELFRRLQALSRFVVISIWAMFDEERGTRIVVVRIEPPEQMPVELCAACSYNDDPAVQGLGANEVMRLRCARAQRVAYA